jgi:polyhydroxyalkanoate synthesis regulator phasin
VPGTITEEELTMVRDSVKSYLALASGLGDLTRQRAVAAARSLAASGEATAEQVQGLAEDLLATSRSNREALSSLVKLEIDRALGRLGLATAEEVTALAARLQRVEARLREQAPAGATPATGKTGTPKAAARKATPAARTTTARKATPPTKPPTKRRSVSGGGEAG